LNWLYYFPMNIVGWIVWSRRRTKSTIDRAFDGDVTSKKFSLIQSLAVYGATALAIFAFAKLISLPAVNAWFYGQQYAFGFDKYLIDSFTTTSSIIAMILMVYRYREQWILWILIDVMSIVLWCYTFDPMMILMWATLLVNAVYGWLKWRVK